MKLFKCEKCGNIIEIVNYEGGVLDCCGEPMQELISNIVDASKEKHVPLCIENDGFVRVKIGEDKHPMGEEHFIKYIICEYKDSVIRYELKAGDEPEAFFDYEEGMVIYAYCNLHGLWKKEL